MSSGVLLFVILAFTGGMIAYAGDNIGRKVGRKHWSIFSLRPKHTGTIVTTVFGIIMIGAVMGVLYAVDGDFRGAVNNETNFWREKFALATSEIERGKLTLARQKAELQRLTAHNLDLRDQEQRIQTQLKLAQQNLENRQARLHQSELALQQRQASLAALSRQEQSLKVRVASLNKENGQLRNQEQRLVVSQRTLTQEITHLAWKVHSVKNTAFAARTGEILLNAEATGGQPVARSQQIIAKTLSVLDKQGPARAAHVKVNIPSQDVEAAVRALQLPGHYLIQVTAANNAGPNDTLSVRLEVLPQHVTSVDIASDILEQDRLKGSRLPQRVAVQRPSASTEPHVAAALTSEDRKGLLEVIQQLSKATAPGSVQSKVLNNPDLGGPLHLRLDTSNSPE